MSLEKLIGKDLKGAEKLVFQIENDISRNQKNIQDTENKLRDLLEEGQVLSSKLAAAKEYLEDLQNAQND